MSRSHTNTFFFLHRAHAPTLSRSPPRPRARMRQRDAGSSERGAALLAANCHTATGGKSFLPHFQLKEKPAEIYDLTGIVIARRCCQAAEGAGCFRHYEIALCSLGGVCTMYYAASAGAAIWRAIEETRILTDGFICRRTVYDSIPMMSKSRRIRRYTYSKNKQ